jgi:hypothetical protein
MLRGATLSASAIAGTAVFGMVVSSASMKTAIATSHGKRFLMESLGEGWGAIGLPQPERLAPNSVDQRDGNSGNFGDNIYIFTINLEIPDAGPTIRHFILSPSKS